MPQTVELAATQAKPIVKAPLVGHVVGGKYRIDGLIGQGGMGVVYSATHLVSDKRVAIKWMLPAPGTSTELAERFVREARATARIDHPNVVDIYDVGVEEGSMFLVMERLHGESLAQRLERGALDATEAVAVLMPALRAVAAAHAQGVIHRDLKPDNIFLCAGPDGEPREPKVLDFGISKIAAGSERHDFSLTQSGTIMGTPLYMSPEQIRGLRDVDARGDVYAFGVILYEMLTGAFPFDAETYNELIVKIATEEPTPITTLLPDLDPGIEIVIARAMARNRDARYESVAELAAALEPYAGGVTFRRVSSVSGNQALVHSQRVLRGTGSPTPRTPLTPQRPLTPQTMSASPTLPSDPALPSTKVATVPGVPVAPIANENGSRRNVLWPVVALCAVAALAWFAWTRVTSEPSAGTRERPTRAAKAAANPAASTTTAPRIAAAAPTEAADDAVPTTVAPGSGEAQAPSQASITAVQGTEAGQAHTHGKHPRRAASPASSASTASATQASAAPAAPGSVGPASLPADWDERLGRSPAAAPATPSSPKHAGTLSVDDL
jgi:serine/threonine-protein kinase